LSFDCRCFSFAWRNLQRNAAFRQLLALRSVKSGCGNRTVSIISRTVRGAAYDALSLWNACARNADIQTRIRFSNNLKLKSGRFASLALNQRQPRREAVAVKARRLCCCAHLAQLSNPNSSKGTLNQVSLFARKLLRPRFAGSALKGGSRRRFRLAAATCAARMPHYHKLPQENQAGTLIPLMPPFIWIAMFTFKAATMVFELWYFSG
jgi:hypothetical protein